ncbi:MAG TPA: hypothetical protein VH637_18450 [Streptosporangiaceae bacterium]|jgi:hypothetical protein
MRTHFEQDRQLAVDTTALLDLTHAEVSRSGLYAVSGQSYSDPSDVSGLADADFSGPDTAGPDSAAPGDGNPGSAGADKPPSESTGELIDHGRGSAHSGHWRGRAIAIGAAVLAAVITFTALKLAGGNATWPASVATVQAQVARSCQNPDVKSEPGQLNFACAKSTRQILWVFALLMSGNNPAFADANTGRVGLEPITPAQGGAVAWSLNLHHPYNPLHPGDSIQVAARAINNIIGGATLTGSNGKPVVQPGLEGNPANCARYTGSAALITRAGFPDICARPVSTRAGQARLVADVYRKWVVGSTKQAAHDAAVLFANSDNPGNPSVQAILKHVPGARPPA